MEQETGFPGLDVLHPLSAGEVLPVLGDRRDYVGGLLRSVVLSVVAGEGAPCTLVTIGQSVVDAHRELVRGFVGTLDMRSLANWQRARMCQISDAPLQILSSPSLEPEALAQKLDTSRSPVVVVDAHGVPPTSRRADRRLVAALRAWARSREAAVLYAPPSRTRLSLPGGWHPRQVTWTVLPPRVSDADRVMVEVRRGMRRLGSEALVWLRRHRTLANEVRGPRVVTLPNGMTVTIERLEDRPSG